MLTGMHAATLARICESVYSGIGSLVDQFRWGGVEWDGVCPVEPVFVSACGGDLASIGLSCGGVGSGMFA